MFSAATLPAITVHEVAPGHFSHHQALRRTRGDVRRTLFSSAFVEGWAHYAEELCVEEGFLADDPRFALGVWLEALVRVTRLACALGVHTAGMTVQEAAARFEADTHLAGPAALSEARRATFDPTYGRYTWGKLEIMALRDRARAAWGADFTLKRFHTALMDLGSPPLGLIGTAIEQRVDGSPVVGVLRFIRVIGLVGVAAAIAVASAGCSAPLNHAGGPGIVTNGAYVEQPAAVGPDHRRLPGHPQQRLGRRADLGVHQRRAARSNSGRRSPRGSPRWSCTR